MTIKLGQALHDCLTIGAHWSRLIASIQSAWTHVQLEHNEEAAGQMRQAADAWKILYDTLTPYLSPSQKDVVEPMHLWMTRAIDHTQLKLEQGGPTPWIKTTLRELLQKIHDRGSQSLEDIIYTVCKGTGGGS